MIAENQQLAAGSNTGSSGDATQVDVIGLVRRRWGVIAFGVIVCTSLAAFYYLTATTIYESTAEILVIPKDSKLATTTATSNGDLGLQSAGDELLATHMQIITSPAIIRKAMTAPELALIDLDSIRAEALKNDDPLVAKTEYIIDYVRENLKVERGGSGAARDAQVLTARMTHTDARDCAAILLAISDQYRTYIGETVKGAGGQAAELITTASKDLHDRLRDSDERYEEFLREAPLLWAQDGTHINPQQARIVRLEDELALLEQQKARAQSRLKLADEVLANGGQEPDQLAMLSVFDGADIERLALLLQIDRGYPASESFQSQLPAAEVESSELLALRLESDKAGLLYGANHPKTRELKQQITRVRSFLDRKNISTDGSVLRQPTIDIADMVPLYRSLLAVDLADLTAREVELRERLDREQETAREMVAAAIEADGMKREIDRTQRLYDVVLARVGEINLLTDYGGFITDMLSPPRLGEKSWPQGSLILPAGCMVGLLLGGCLAVAADLMDRSFRTQDDVEAELGVPVLSHVSTLDANAKPSAEFQQLASTMVTMHSPRSRDAEAFRVLRTTLMFNARDVKCPVVQVTSPSPGDGKSTVISNLALSLAQAGKSVLLIDADMRRPTVHANLGVEKTPGLSELLGSVATLDSVVQQISGAPSLSAISSGKVPGNPAELLSGAMLPELLEELRSLYEWVLIDSPPVNAVSDPVVIAPHADSILMVLSLRERARAAARMACRQLGDVGAELSGVVVNRAASAHGAYSGDYTYGSNYLSHKNVACSGRYGYSSSCGDAYYGEGSSE